MGLEGRCTIVAYVVIVQCLVVHLIVGSGILDEVILHLGVAVATPFGIQCDGSLAGLALLSGNHHHTVGTTGTIQGIGGGILQHRYIFHIVGVEVVPTSIVRSTIDDNQRVATRIDRAESTDAEYRGGIGCTATLHHLEAGYLSLQTADDVGYLFLLQCLTLDDGGRTGKRGAFLLAESHHQHLVQLFGIGM